LDRYIYVWRYCPAVMCLTHDGTYRQGVVVSDELTSGPPCEEGRQLDHVGEHDSVVAAEEGRGGGARGAQHNGLHLDTHENEGGGVRGG
jgi:hypothetical protein